MADQRAICDWPRSGATVIATGRSYHQDYAFYLRARGGKIVLIRENFDAVRLVAALRETSDDPREG
jgi:ketosteroid isomerase-like protein